MKKLVLLAALVFALATGAAVTLSLTPETAMACPSSDGC
jgi:hypothetical protein